MQCKSYLSYTFYVVATDAHLYTTKNIITINIHRFFIHMFTGFFSKKVKNIKNYSTPENENHRD
jgi:hypothetical protein